MAIQNWDCNLNFLEHSDFWEKLSMQRSETKFINYIPFLVDKLQYMISLGKKMMKLIIIKDFRNI